MAVYLDTSIVASLFVVDAHSSRARSWLGRTVAVNKITLSDWALAEFTSVLATATRAGRVPAAMRSSAERGLNQWLAQQAVVAVLSDDVRQARTLINSTGEPLRAPDALHLAVALRHRAALATFDLSMRRAAADVGLSIEDV